MSENKNPDTSTPEDNKNDIPLRELSQTSPKRTPSITPPTTPPPPSNLSSSSQVSQSGNIPDKIRYPQDEFKKGSTKEELVNPGHTESKSGKLESMCLGILLGF